MSRLPRKDLHIINTSNTLHIDTPLSGIVPSFFFFFFLLSLSLLLYDFIFVACCCLPLAYRFSETILRTRVWFSLRGFLMEIHNH